jgi:hypothetical protein
MAPKLYWREFTRNGTADIDHGATPEFLARNFVDFFGTWLQQDDNASTPASYDTLIRVFWSKCRFTGMLLSFGLIKHRFSKIYCKNIHGSG